MRAEDEAGMSIEQMCIFHNIATNTAKAVRRNHLASE